MKRKVRGTNLEAWERIKKKLTPREQMVVTVYRKRKRATQRDAARILKVPVHTISGRFSSLEAKKVLKDVGLKYYQDSKQPHTVYEFTGKVKE